jgi:hypothetical protein
MLSEVSFGVERQMAFEKWRDEIMVKVKELSKHSTYDWDIK